MSTLRWVLGSAVLLAGACGEPRPDAEPQPGASPPAADTNVLLQPTNEAFTATAPDTFRVRFETSEGDFVVEVVRDWAPIGADRFYNLVQNGFYDGVRFFRVIDGFMVQFGLHGDPRVNAAWRNAAIVDDPVRQSNRRGTLSFATRGANTRTTQVFINFRDNANLDEMDFAPLAHVVAGMDVVDALHAGYGEGSPRGQGPDQDSIHAYGNAYLERDFPELDYVRQARIVER